MSQGGSQAQAVHKALLDAVDAHRRGELDKAQALYRAILRAAPDHFDATHLLGALLSARGDSAAAEKLLRRAVALNPRSAAAHNNLGNVMKTLRRDADALACYGNAVALDPNYADGWNNRANLLDDLGRGEEALADYEHALRLNPGYANALVRSAKLLAALGRSEDALVRQDRAIALGADSADVWMRSGNVLMQLKRYGQALESYDRVLALSPKNMLCAVNRSVALFELGRIAQAKAALDAILAQEPNNAGALNNKATCLKAENRLDEALDLYRRALALAPQDADAQTNFAMTLLLKGDFYVGWRAFEHRWARKENAGKRPLLPFPEWRGHELKGRSILVYAEQGAGDIVQFARYLPLLAARGADVAFLVPGRMHAMLRAAFPTLRLFDEASQVQDLPFDFQIAMMSLPLQFDTRIETIPAEIPYLRAFPAKIAAWRERIGAPGFKIGIAWQGNPRVSVDAGRSIALAAFAPLAQVPGVRLVSLQKNEGSEQLSSAPMRVAELGPDFDSGRDSFVDTLAAMESLDLVITSDTAIAHIAGALGRPVWVALKYAPDWRWMLGRDDSPWYPTMRLYRQQAPGAWAGVFEKMRDALTARSGTAPLS